MNEYYPINKKKHTIVAATNRNIRDVLSVLCHCSLIAKEHRVEYAKQGEVVEIQRDEKGKKAFVFRDYIRDGETLCAKLYEVLFNESKQITDFSEDEARYYVTDTDTNELINRAEVMRGRDDFLSGFGLTSHEVWNFLNYINGNQNIPKAGKSQPRQSSTSKE